MIDKKKNNIEQKTEKTSSEVKNEKNKASESKNQTTAATSEARKILDVYIKDINKKYGTGTVRFLGENTVEKWDSIPTGSLKLDRITGIGGIPFGRITEIYGLEGSGKTTLALTTIAQAQKQGYQCAFLDVEHAISESHAKELGVDLTKLLFTQPDTGEQCFQIIDDLVRSGAVNLIVVDSVAAIVPLQESEEDFTKSIMGVQARLMSLGLKRIVRWVSKFKCALLFINQVRMKIGVMFGSPETTSGGMALKYYASLRIAVSKKTQVTAKSLGPQASHLPSEQVAGQQVGFRILKNKFAAPHRDTVTTLIFHKGFDNQEEAFDLAVEFGIIIQKGAWYSYKGKNFAQGKEGCMKILRDNAGMMDELINQIKKHPLYNGDTTDGNTTENTNNKTQDDDDLNYLSNIEEEEKFLEENEDDPDFENGE